jgi:hypothetical protein
MINSATAISCELDDAPATARELAASIRGGLDLESSSVGILICDADADGAAISGELKDLLGIDIAGMTTLAALNADGHREAAITLTVLTSSDCTFSAAVSAPLTKDGCEREIADAYGKTRSAAPGGDEKPGVIFVFCPYGLPFSGDKYPDAFAKIVPGVPVMGGVASDDYDYERAGVFFSGGKYRDAMALISIRGAVKPAFAIRHVTSRFAERIRRVVEAEGNIVYRVGDETLIEYLAGFGLKTDVDDPLLAFNSYPMMLTREGGDETPLMRHISGLNHDDGSGAFFGDVPTGAMANICLVNKDDVRAACRESMSALLAEAEKRSDYTYSTVFCISCCGRAMILGADSSAEGQILSEMLPAGLKLMGAYCLGEICPTRHSEGEAVNRFHNCSITLCIL